jgi:predicted nucleotidyltransferase
MKSLEAISALERQTAALRARGATSLYLFGSTTRDRATESSDLDLFIDYDANTRFSLLDLVGMQNFLEAQLQMRVDLTTRDSLDPLLRTKIEMSAIRVF